ncbi:MAG: hypothetical protein ABI696_15360 [Rubrivivax sp.]
MNTLLLIFPLALLAIGVAVAGMAVGLMFKRPCLRGSCGGPGVVAPDGHKLSCASCPNRRRREGPSPTDS